MDLNALRTRVRKLTGVQMETLLTPTELDQIINEAYTYVCSLSDWQFLKVEASTTVSNGTREVAFPSPVTLPFSVAVRSPDQALLRPRRQEDFDRYPQWEAEATSGVPWAWALKDNDTIELFPVPDQSVDLRVRGWKDAAELSADGDTPVFASQFHPVVSLDAARRVLAEEGDDSGRADRYRRDVITYLMHMGRRYLLDDPEEAARVYSAAIRESDEVYGESGASESAGEATGMRQ